MMYVVGGRGSGKSITAYRNYCEKAAELELQIEFAKRAGLKYDIIQKRLDEIYEKIDGGRNETKQKTK